MFANRGHLVPIWRVPQGGLIRGGAKGERVSLKKRRVKEVDRSVESTESTSLRKIETRQGEKEYISSEKRQQGPGKREDLIEIQSPIRVTSKAEKYPFSKESKELSQVTRILRVSGFTGM